eukprot:m.394984 g.394984  ORF g.394984 m.394984 type:complete len:539 (+) comp56382_c0_seq2:434-2050(+)
METEEVDVLIIGAGPTGLGAATRLHQHRQNAWKLVEASDVAGGSARTDTTPEGFCFDQGGHVIYSHSKYFDDLLNTAFPGEDTWNLIERSTYVWMKERLIPYPFHSNFNALDPEDQLLCLQGLVDASTTSQTCLPKPANLDEWFLKVMGKGIADLYMRPYNFKVWAAPITLLQCDWLGDRTFKPLDIKQSLENVLLGRRTTPPKVTFRFPKHGGTGSIWTAIAKTLPQDKVIFGKKIIALDLEGHRVVLSDGKAIKYKHCISSMPLDYTLQCIGRDDLASKLMHSSSHIVGLGMRGKAPSGRKCWFYFPESNCEFYRATCFSTYAKEHCPPAETLLATVRKGSKVVSPPGNPAPGPYWSLMFEVSESKYKPVNLSTIIEDTIKGALNVHLISEDTEIVSVYHSRISHGYPVPTLSRDEVLEEALPMLKSFNFLSRGRFGSYKYEISNQDHCVHIGAEAVDHILFGATEVTHTFPELIGRSRNVDLKYSVGDEWVDFSQKTSPQFVETRSTLKLITSAPSQSIATQKHSQLSSEATPSV